MALKQCNAISHLAKQVVQGSDADAVDYASSLSGVIASCFDGDDSTCPSVFHQTKSTKQIDYLLGLHKFDELIKMFCDDAEDKLEPAQIAFEIERVFSTLLSIHKKKEE